MALKDSQWFSHLQVVDVEVVAVVEDPDAVEDARRGPVVEADAAPVEHIVEHAENGKQLMKVLFVTQCTMITLFCSARSGLDNVRPASHIRTAKHFNEAFELH